MARCAPLIVILHLVPLWRSVASSRTFGVSFKATYDPRGPGFAGAPWPYAEELTVLQQNCTAGTCAMHHFWSVA